jgi:Fur family ferric uptake transcriptional regulator
MRKRKELSRSIHDAGGRMTEHRRVILEVLASVNSHPTAAELHDMVRQRLPGISPGTVYRNLRVLKDLGYLQELDFGAAASRFDADVAAHCHVRCDSCGRVDDVPLAANPRIEDAQRLLDGWKIEGQRVEFHGLCPDCVAAAEQSGQEGGDGA